MKMCLSLTLVSGLLLPCAPMLAEKPPLQLADPGTSVKPIRIAAIKMIDGRARLDGDWVPYSGFSGRMDVASCYDGFGREWGVGAVDTPSEPPTSLCGLGGSRWYFGPDYENPYTEDDLDNVVPGPLATTDVGWFWNPPAGSGQYFLFVLWNDATDVNNCVTSGGLGTLGGFVADFGDLPSGNPFYYFSCIDVSSLGLSLDASMTSQVLIGAEAFDPLTGQITLAAGPTQFMLWGATNNTGTGYVPFSGAVGTQEEGTLDDDAPTDGVLDTAAECYSYLFGVCPDPLGKMVAYGAALCGGACPADFNGDGFVSGDDFDQYVAAFELGDASADFNCDGFVSGDDFDAFVAAFELGCG